MAITQGSPTFPVTPPASQVDGAPTIGAGHPAPIQAPPNTTGVAAKSTNSATGTKQPDTNKTPKKHDSAS